MTESIPDLLGDVHVAPVATAAGYIGGKRMLAKRLIPLIDSTPHKAYAEPFVGMGGVFLRRRIQRRAEIINDRSQDVATFFRILQRHYTAFTEMLRFQLTTRREFERLQATDPSTLTDLERAARFLYLQSCAFGGKVMNRAFGVSVYDSGAFNILTLIPRLEAIHERLAGVIIENLDFGDFITRYDKPETLFYLDPPYHGSEADYGKDVFSRADFARLADLLTAIEGRFILSINDTPEIRETFAAFEQTPVQVKYTLSDKTVADAAELIIRDRKPR